MAVTTASDLIPVLDLTGLRSRDPDVVARLGRELRAALTDVGFFFLTNHGIPWEQVQGIYDWARRLHALDPEVLARAPMDKHHGGYLGLGGGTSYASEIAGEIRTPNLNAAFFVHRGGHRSANRFPDGLPGFPEAAAAYMDACTELCEGLLPVLAAALDLPPGWFEPSFVDPSVTLRMSHYPPLEYGEHDWGLAPHTDSSIFTLLPANDVPGLEIRPAGHDWIVPPALPGSYSGDMLKRWTNHRFRSTAHRARNASDTDRYAIPFFYGARDDALIEALPTCVGPGEPARHEPITYGAYQRWFINRNYAQVTGEQAGDVAP
jgi:isopenicillin N synthase-like dioxygenase